MGGKGREASVSGWVGEGGVKAAGCVRGREGGEAGVGPVVEWGGGGKGSPHIQGGKSRERRDVFRHRSRSIAS